MSSPTIFFAVELKQLFYTYRQTAELLAVSEGFIQRLVQGGQLKRVFLTPGVDRKQPRIVSQSIIDYVRNKIAEIESSSALADPHANESSAGSGRAAS